MGKEILTFDNIETEKKKLLSNKKLLFRLLISIIL